MRYRKKPVEVEAVQVPDGPLTTPELGKAWGKLFGFIEPCPEWMIVDGLSVQIHTMEGLMTASPGDWIIRGVQGEFYPCKPDIFELTYEPVEEIEE